MGLIPYSIESGPLVNSVSFIVCLLSLEVLPVPVHHSSYRSLQRHQQSDFPGWGWGVDLDHSDDGERVGREDTDN